MPDRDNKLIEYALGILDEKTAKTLQAEIDSSAQDKAALRDIERALTLLAEAEQPLAPPQNLRERILHSVRHETRFAGFVERLCGFFDLKRAAIEKHLSSLNHVSAETWQFNAFPGTHLYHFEGGPQIAENADCGLVYVEPGKMIAAHRHLGDEWSFVLQGQMKEVNGAVYHPGDCIHRPTGSVHALQSVGKEPLVFAAVLIEGLEFIAE
ncbi:Cupin domain-containing protein [Nitrosomonas sp. Nm51]|uniref:cupin domain-containing protein n=1 Tax=Nitrosomonas sp. Nm51 TaxID=133720 RepID=UPI0008C78FDF|nr:cupin domain-containing protein [Nitrosomonas sp. Nm51]SER17607.1 Cupin domain-containing protein [Nitrosomonas sp. Nm51]